MSTDVSTKIAPPDILRAAALELVVQDLSASRAFYHDVLGLLISYEDSEEIHFRGFEEYVHHSLVLRRGPAPAMQALTYRVRGARDLEIAERYYGSLNCPVKRLPAGTVRGFGELVQVQDPLGFPLQFFWEAEHLERYTQRYDEHRSPALLRLDHFNILTPDVAGGERYYETLGFRLAEQIQDDAGTKYAVWMFRKPSVHDIALTAGDGPRLHHFAFNVAERHEVLHLCDRLGDLRQAFRIERGPGRHGVSNALYVYLRDPDGHRIEVFTQHYYTGDPDNPIKTWSVHDERRRSWWGHAVKPTWYTEGTPVLNEEGDLQPVVQQGGSSELRVTVGADEN